MEGGKTNGGETGGHQRRKDCQGEEKGEKKRGEAEIESSHSR